MAGKKGKLLMTTYYNGGESWECSCYHQNWKWQTKCGKCGKRRRKNEV